MQLLCQPLWGSRGSSQATGVTLQGRVDVSLLCHRVYTGEEGWHRVFSLAIGSGIYSAPTPSTHGSLSSIQLPAAGQKVKASPKQSVSNHRTIPGQETPCLEQKPQLPAHILCGLVLLREGHLSPSPQYKPAPHSFLYSVGIQRGGEEAEIGEKHAYLPLENSLQISSPYPWKVCSSPGQTGTGHWTCSLAP